MTEAYVVQDEERLQILRMLESGKISTSEAAALLGALSVGNKSQSPQRERVGEENQWFRVRVTDTLTGKRKATINIPLSLMDWGLKIGAQFAPEVASIDLDEISSALRVGAGGKIVEVFDEEDGEHVEVFID